MCTMAGTVQTGQRCRLTSIDHGRRLQIRRRKCNGDPDELDCDLRPSIESFCQVAKTLQHAHGIQDQDVKFFLAADEPATYAEARHALPPLTGLHACSSKEAPQIWLPSGIILTAICFCPCTGRMGKWQGHGDQTWVSNATCLRLNRFPQMPGRWTTPSARGKPSNAALQVVRILGKEQVIYTDNGIAPSALDEVTEDDVIAKVQTAAANPGTLTSALIDMALMSRCNDLVVTMSSSFGYVAVRPWPELQHCLLGPQRQLVA